MENLIYNTPQDKLLVMLNERISALEDIVLKNNNYMERLLSITSFEYFGVHFTGKYITGGGIDGSYINLRPHVSSIVKIFMETLPISHVYVNDMFEYTSCHIVVHTKDKWLYDSVQRLLTIKFQNLEYANYNSISAYERLPLQYELFDLSQLK